LLPVLYLIQKVGQERRSGLPQGHHKPLQPFGKPANACRQAQFRDFVPDAGKLARRWRPFERLGARSRSSACRPPLTNRSGAKMPSL